MAFAYLIDPENQFMTKSGTINVDGFLRVFDAATDDPAVTYKDFHGTANPERIALDNNGRAVVIADSDRAYRLEVYDRYGTLMWTTSPLWCQASGGGVAGTDVTSSDGSVHVDRITVGSMTTFDLSLAEDSTDLLNWIRCEGAQKLDGTDTWKPTYAAGTMVVGEKGIVLSVDQYYHVTAHIRATKSSAAPYYDDIFLLYKLDDGTTVTPVTRQTVIVDCSLGLSQDFEFSTDVMAESDCELLLDILGQEQAGISFEVLNVELHRVYSGAPHIPGGTIRAEQSDWTETDASKMSFIKHKPDLSLYVTDSELETILEGYATTTALSTGLATKQDTISDLSDIRAGAALGSTAVQPGDLATVATTGSYNDLLDKPTIPTVPVQDVEVNGSSVVNAQGVAEITIDTGAFVAVYGSTTMAQVTAAYDAGKDIVCRYNDGRGRVYSGQLSSFSYGVYTFSTTDGFSEYDFTLSPNGGDGAWAISSKSIPSVDSSYNASSYAAQSGVAVAQALSSYTPTASLSTVALTGDYDDLLNKPVVKPMVAGSNVTITESSDDITIAATDTTYSAGTGLDLTGTAFSVDTSVIQPKLTAGSNISISGNNEISATDTTYSAGTGLSLNGTTFSNADPLPEHTSSQSGRVLGVDSSGDLDWVELSPGVIYTAGNGIDITSDVISVDTSVVATQADLADYTPTASLATVALTGDYDDLLDKPAIPVLPDTKDLVAGSNISIVETANDVTISATDTTYTAGNGLSLNGTAFSVDTSVVQPKLTAGSNISISGNNEISATDTTYSAGTGLDLTGTTFSVDTSVVQPKLTAGSNVTISANNEISATDTTYSAGTGLDLTGTTFSVDTTTIATKSDLPDLTPYVTDTDLATILQGYQTALSAGSNIQISNGTISATDTTYTAGNGISLSGTEFSVDTSVVATQSDLADYTPTASLATVATTGDYDDLLNKPAIPVLPDTKDLVAGDGISITETANDVTVACSITVGTVTI